MFVLGLTGSVGMGKTTAAEVFRQQKISVFDADKVVRRLLGGKGEVVKKIENVFKGVVYDGQVDRHKLSEIVFTDKKALPVLEGILHPLVRDQQVKFLKSASNQRRLIVVLDVPLLFETGGEVNCDAVAVVSAPLYLQKIRVMRREGMTEEKFNGILCRQMLDSEKRRRADFIIPTGLGKRVGLQIIKKIIRNVVSRPVYSRPHNVYLK